MNPFQRRVTLAICISVGLTFLVSAGLTFLINPMSEDLKLGSGAIELVLAIPSIASLIVIFIAGQMGDRLGHRRSILGFTALFVGGSVMIAAAQSALAVSVGLALVGAGATAIQIISVGLLQKTVPDGEAHVSAFTTFGMIYPLTFVVFPVLTAGILNIAVWRVIPAIWAGAGLLIAIVAALLLEHEKHRHKLGEWLTPLLAGFALAALVRFFDSIGRKGFFTPATIIGFGIFVLAAVVFIARFVMASETSFSFAPLRSSMLRILLLGVVLVALVGTLTYIILSFEYLYGMSSLQAALAVVPAQAGAVLGAKVLAGQAIKRWGINRAARHLVLVLSFTALTLVGMQESTPSWYLMLSAALLSTAAIAAITVLNTDVMSQAPPDNAGPYSSFRGAASSIGAGLGVVVLGTSVITAVNMSGSTADVSLAQKVELAKGLRIDGFLGFAISLLAWAALYAMERRTANVS